MKDIKSGQLAIIMLVILIAGIFFALRAGLTADIAQKTGPHYIDVSERGVFVQWQNKLFVLGMDGAIQHEVDLGSLGENIIISDMQVIGDEMLIGEVNQRQIYRCQLTPFSCQSLLTQKMRIRTPFKFRMDKRGDLWISQGPISQLSVLPRGEEKLLSVVLSGEGLNQPNRVLLEEDLVIVADTNNHRIVAYRPDQNDAYLLHEDFSFKVTDHPQARSRHIWPVDVSLDSNGRWWVLNTDDFLNNADLATYGSDGKPEQIISFPQKGDLGAIAFYAGNIFVTDIAQFAVYSVDSKTNKWMRFGDVDFNAELKKAVEEKQLMEQRSTLYLYAILICLAIGFALAFWFERHKLKKEGMSAMFTRPSNQKVESHLVRDESDVDIQWFIPDQKRMRRMKFIVYYSIAWSIAFLIMCVWFSLMMAAEVSMLRLASMLIAVLSIAISVPIVSILAFRQSRNRLGFKKNMIYIRDHRLNVRKVPVEKIVYSKRGIHFEYISIVLADGHGKLFYSEKNKDFIFNALLIPAIQIKEWRVFLYQLKHHQPLAISAVFMGGVMLASLLFLN